MENCLFCRIAAGKLPSTIVYDDDDVVAFRDAHPQAPHHILFIPRRHVSSMTDLTLEDGPILARIYTTAIKVAQELGLEESGYRFVTNVGHDAGQTIFHLH